MPQERSIPELACTRFRPRWESATRADQQLRLGEEARPDVSELKPTAAAAGAKAPATWASTAATENALVNVLLKVNPRQQTPTRQGRSPVLAATPPCS